MPHPGDEDEDVWAGGDQFRRMAADRLAQKRAAAARTATEPGVGDRATGALSGGMKGAQLGATLGSVVPGVGTVLGAAAGGGVGALLGGFTAEPGERAPADTVDQGDRLLRRVRAPQSLESPARRPKTVSLGDDWDFDDEDELA